MAYLVGSNFLLVPRTPRDFTSMHVPEIRRVAWHLRRIEDAEGLTRTVEVRSGEDALVRVFTVARGTDAGRQATQGGWYLVWTGRGDVFKLGWLLGRSELDPHEYWFAHGTPNTVWDAVRNLSDASDLVFRCDFVSVKHRSDCLPLHVQPACMPSIAGALLRLVNAHEREVREIFETNRRLRYRWLRSNVVRDAGGD